MLLSIYNALIKQNQWYDSLATNHKSTRFQLFLIPLMIGLNLDLISAMLGGPVLFTYVIMFLMALWRLPSLLGKNRNQH